IVTVFMKSILVFSDSLSDMCKAIPALTTLERTKAAQVRKEHMTVGVNKESLNDLERAIVFVTLDTKQIDDMSARGKYLLHGDGKSMWFEKSINMVFFADGRVGFNGEHSY
ncbi:hypothetical protein LOTGIDRAFT_100929, partial [Lottia gigantea]